MKLKEMMEKYKDIVPYAIFGILTTIINIVVYLFFAHMLHGFFLCCLPMLQTENGYFTVGYLHLVILSERLWLFLYAVWRLVWQIS